MVALLLCCKNKKREKVFEIGITYVILFVYLFVCDSEVNRALSLSLLPQWSFKELQGFTASGS